jgi:hypothetical protein
MALGFNQSIATFVQTRLHPAKLIQANRNEEGKLMREDRLQRTLMSLALSAGIHCLTSRYTGHVLVGLGKLIFLLLCVSLLLFVIDNAPSAYQAAIASLGQMVWSSLPPLLPCAITGRDRTIALESKAPLLPSRFQRPPPISF